MNKADNNRETLHTFLSDIKQAGAKMFSQAKMQAACDDEASQLMYSGLANSLNNYELFGNNELRNSLQMLNKPLSSNVNGKRIQELQSEKRASAKQAKKDKEMLLLQSPASSVASPSKKAFVPSPSTCFVASPRKYSPMANMSSYSSSPPKDSRFYRNKLEDGGMDALIGPPSNSLSVKDEIVDHLLKNSQVGSDKISTLIGIISDPDNMAARNVINAYERMVLGERPDIGTIVEKMLQLFVATEDK